MESEYRSKNQILTGFGRRRKTRSAENPGGMIDKTRLTPEGYYRVIPFTDLVQ